MKSNRPYLLRALYEWILDNDMTPYLLVDANASENEVPEQYIEDKKILLNLHPAAVKDLELANERISFNARFGGCSHHISVETGSILAIYAKENGMGMIFQEEKSNTETAAIEEKKSQIPDLKIVK
jgi:stringent starvation protein B